MMVTNSDYQEEYESHNSFSDSKDRTPISDSSNFRKRYSSLDVLKDSKQSGMSNAFYNIPASHRGKRIEKYTKRLEDSINHSLIFPVEYLESQLFDLCRSYYYKFPDLKDNLSLIATLHPLLKLIEKENINSEKWKDMLVKYLSYNSNGITEYNFIQKFGNLKFKV